MLSREEQKFLSLYPELSCLCAGGAADVAAPQSSLRNGNLVTAVSPLRVLLWLCSSVDAGGWLRCLVKSSSKAQGLT